MPRTKTRRVSKLLDRQGFAEVLSRESECILDTIGLRIELKHGGVLRLPAGPPMVKNHHFRGGSSNIGAHIFFNQTQRHVDTGGHSCPCSDRAARNAHTGPLDPYHRKTPRQLPWQNPGSPCTSTVSGPPHGH